MSNYDFSELTGTVITRETEDYHVHRLGWNRAIDKSPLLIVYCYENMDIINAINFARKESLGIRVRSGGHHYEGYSTGDDVIVIDVSKMNKIIVDEDKNQVKIQGGVRNRELYEATGALEYPFPGGGCPTVGVPGLVLGAGWGYSARYLGMASDSLTELQIIDYNGQVVMANREKNSDLFWACRGAGGGNFGVIVSMTFNLPKKCKMGTLITIEYHNVSESDNIKILKLCQKEFKTLDRRLNMKIGNYNSKDKGRGVKIVGLFYGNKDECEKILYPFKEVRHNNIKLEYKTIREINTIIQDSHPDYESYKSTGRFVYKDYSDEELSRIISMVSERAEGSIYTAVSFYGLGGAVRDKKDEDGAFAYRDANFIMGYQSVWEDEKYAKINRDWVIEKFNIMKSLTRGSFINFPIEELPNYQEEYYEKNLEKLKEIKKKYDPYCIFDFEQGLK